MTRLEVLEIADVVCDLVLSIVTGNLPESEIAGRARALLRVSPLIREELLTFAPTEVVAWVELDTR